MDRKYRNTGLAVGLMVLLGGSPSWAGPPPNPTASDAGGNTAGGTNALQNNAGTFNTAFGTFTLFFNTTGIANTTGNNNTALGVGAGNTLVSGSDNIYIGHPGGTATESQTLRLGNGQTQTFIAGIANASLLFVGLPVVVNAATNQVSALLSSARYKQDIKDVGTQSQKLGQLRPVSFRYKSDPQRVRQYGLIAEEVAEVYPELVVRGADGTIEGVRYQELLPLVLHAVQQQQEQLTVQAKQLRTQGQELADVRMQNESLRSALGQMEAQAQEMAALKAQVAALMALSAQEQGSQAVLAAAQK